MNLLMCFIALFAFALLLVKIDDTTKHKAVLDSKGKLIIHLSWDPQSPVDLDLWVRTDNPSSIVSFRRMDSGNMWLDHDSRGSATNRVTMRDGNIKNTLGNDEVVQFKECTNTRVTVNVHYYNTPSDIPYRTKATVEVIIPTPYRVIHARQFDMVNRGEEFTAFSFDLDEQCNISNIDETFVPFIYSTQADGTTMLPLIPPSSSSEDGRH